MGLPLTLFSQGSLFSPYTCLQQMDSLTSTTVSSYLVGSTNGLFLRQKDRYSDILIDLDEHKLSISSRRYREVPHRNLTLLGRFWEAPYKNSSFCLKVGLWRLQSVELGLETFTLATSYHFRKILGSTGPNKDLISYIPSTIGV